MTMEEAKAPTLSEENAVSILEAYKDIISSELDVIKCESAAKKCAIYHVEDLINLAKATLPSSSAKVLKEHYEKVKQHLINL